MQTVVQVGCTCRVHIALRAFPDRRVAWHDWRVVRVQGHSTVLYCGAICAGELVGRWGQVGY